MKKLAFLFLFLPLLALADGQVGTYPSPFLTTNLSGSITTGGTFQTLTAVSGTRHSIEFENICNVGANCGGVNDNCYIFFGSGTATAAKSLLIPTGSYYLRAISAIPADQIQVTCDTTGDKFYAVIQ